MPQAYYTSPKRGQDSPPGQRNSPPRRSHKGGRSSKPTSPLPLSPNELADYILERGNKVTSPIIAKIVLDQHLDGRALAEFVDDSDSEEPFTSVSVLHDKDLANDFLRTTSPLRRRLPPVDLTRSVRPSLMEIASLLETAQVSAVSPASTAPAFMTPRLSPFIPEWDLEDPDSPEDLEIFAPMQGALDDSDEDDDLLRSPGLRTFRVSGPPSTDDVRGTYSSLLRPVPPFTPETMPLLSALDMRQPPYGNSPHSSLGVADGLGDRPGQTQADLLNRQRSLGNVSQPSFTQESSAPRMSRAASKTSMFGAETTAQEPFPRPSSCPPRAVRPRIIIPDTFWLPTAPPPPPEPVRSYAEMGVQTEELAGPAATVRPSGPPVEAASDTEDTSFYDARDSHSTTESVRDTDEDTDHFHDLAQSGDEEYTAAPDTPKPSSRTELPADVPTPRASTPATSTPAPLPATNPQVQRLKADNSTPGLSSVAPPLTRTTSEPQRTSAKRAPARPTLDTKRAHSSAGSSSQGPRSAPPQSIPTAQTAKSTKTAKAGRAANRSSTSKPSTPSARTPQSATATRREAETKTNEKRATGKEPNHVPEASSTGPANTVPPSIAPAPETIDNSKLAVDPTVRADVDSRTSQGGDETMEGGSESLVVPEGVQSTEDKPTLQRTEQSATEVSTASTPLDKEHLSEATVNSQEPAAGTSESARLGQSEQADQKQADTDEDASRAETGKAKEVNDGEIRTPKPSVRVPILVGAAIADSRGTTPSNELSSDAREQVDSALSSSILPESTSSEGLSSSGSAEENAGQQQDPAPVDGDDAASSPPSTLLDSTAPKPGDADGAADTTAKNSAAVAAQDSSDPVDISASAKVDVISSVMPDQSTPEGFVDIQSSDANESFENIDRDEAVGADEHTGNDDLGDPWTSPDEAADAVATTGTGSEEFKNRGDDAEGQADATVQDAQVTGPSKDATQLSLAPAKLSEEAQVAPPALTSSTRPVDDATRPANDVPRVETLQSAEPTERQDEAQLVSPAVSRVRAVDSLERDISQATDSQTEDGGDISNVDGAEDNAGKPLSKNQKKKAKKKQEAAKKLQEAQELAKQEAEKNRTLEEAAVAQRQQEAEDAVTRAKERERLAAPPPHAADVEAEKQRPAEQQVQQQSATETWPTMQSARRQGRQQQRQQQQQQQQHLPVIQTQTHVITNTRSFKRDLETGPVLSPMPSPSSHVRRVPTDIESQTRAGHEGSKQRDGSPSSINSRDSSWNAVTSTAANLWSKIRK